MVPVYTTTHSLTRSVSKGVDFGPGIMEARRHADDAAYAALMTGGCPDSGEKTSAASAPDTIGWGTLRNRLVKRRDEVVDDQGLYLLQLQVVCLAELRHVTRHELHRDHRLNSCFVIFLHSIM